MLDADRKSLRSYLLRGMPSVSFAKDFVFLVHVHAIGFSYSRSFGSIEELGSMIRAFLRVAILILLVDVTEKKRPIRSLPKENRVSWIRISK